MSTIKVQNIQHTSSSTNAIALASDGTCIANITNNLSNRRLTINGAMTVSQRGSTFAAIAHNAYCLDRYKFTHSGSAVYTISQSTTSPDDFANSLKIVPTTADTSIAATDYTRLVTVLEGQDLQQFAKGTSSAKKAVLSFYVKSNKTGTYSLFYFDSNNNRQFNATYTVSNTNWNRYTIPIAADTTGAFTNNNLASLEIYWHLVAGSNRTSGSLDATWNSYTATKEAAGHNINFADSTSNEFYITGIQLEVDNTSSGKATDFEHRSFGQELALCQRYLYVLCDQAGGSTSRPVANLVGYTTSYLYGVCDLPVEMRLPPTIVSSSGTSYFILYGGGGTTGIYAPQVYSARQSTSTVELQVITATTNVVAASPYFMRTNNASAYVQFWAEL